MSPWLWLAVWFLGVFLSVATHEVAHVLTALNYRWLYHGLFFKWYVLGIGVRLEPPDEGADKHLWKIALAGPMASFLLAGLFLAFTNDTSDSGIVMYSLFMLNLVVGVINLIPTPITDGGHVLSSLTGWKLKWRHFFGVWVFIEIAVVIGAAATYLLS